MSRPEPSTGVMADAPSIPRDADGPVFPTPWAARAFALAVAAHEKRLFAWSEWSDALGAELQGLTHHLAEPEAYWLAWLAALENMLACKSIASRSDLLAVQNAWRDAAEATPHGTPIALVAS